MANQLVAIDLPQVVVCFQPDIAPKLFEMGASKLILVSSQPFSGKPVSTMHSGPEYPEFIGRLVKWYEKHGFYLKSVTSCTPCNPVQYRHIRCCGAAIPTREYCQKPHRFEFVRGDRGGGMVHVSHYVSSGFPHHMSHELKAELQEAGILLLSIKWVPPPRILDLFDDPIPRTICADSRLFEYNTAPFEINYYV